MRNGIGYAAPGLACNSAVPSVLTPSSPYGTSPNWGSNCGLGVPALDFSIVSANKGGMLNVQSSSPIAPSSITVQSENIIEGTLSTIGRLPFLSAVTLEGTLPTYGSGGVQYRCGEGIALLSEHFGEDILNGDINNINNEAVNVQPNYALGCLAAGYGRNDNGIVGNHFRSCLESANLKSSRPGKC